MKRKLYKITICLLWTLSLVLTSCKTDLTNLSTDINLQQSLAIPVGEATISVNDLLSRLDVPSISTTADTINFTTDFNYDFSFVTPNFITTSQQKNNTNSLSAAAVGANANIPIPGNLSSIELGLDPTSLSNRFDSVKVARIAFNLTIKDVQNINVTGSSTPISPSDLKITLIFPKIRYTNSSGAVSKDITLTQFNQAVAVELNNVVLSTARATGIPFQINIKTGNRSITIGSGGSMSSIVQVNRIDYQVAYGSFQPSSNVPTTIKMPLDILSSLPSGISFANPKAIITINHNIGSYLTYNIVGIKSFSKDRSIIRQALFNGNPTATENLSGKPSVPGNFVTQAMKTLDKNYGTTDQLFDTNVKLDTLEYKFQVQNNDVLNNANLPSFAIPGMKVSANIKVQIPMFFKAGSNITVTDTIQKIDGFLNKISSAALVMTATNNLPVKIALKMKFMNATNSVIQIPSINDSTYTINSAQVNNLGIVTSPTVSKLRIELTAAQTGQLNAAKSMIFIITVSGQDASKAIQFTKNNYFKLKLGVLAKGNYFVNTNN
jgi:hypothetical protein